jgi:hypothetical protein
MVRLQRRSLEWWTSAVFESERLDMEKWQEAFRRRFGEKRRVTFKLL